MNNASVRNAFFELRHHVTRAPATVALGITSVVIYFIPELAKLFELNVSAVIEGQWWRLLTGHVTHWSLDHLVWDLAVFLAVGWACEAQNRRATWLTIASSIVAISVAAVFWLELDSYRGLSGVDTALFALFGWSMLANHIVRREFAGTLLFGTALIGMFAKVAFELTTGQCLFVDPMSSGFVPVPLAHLVGATIGLAFGLASRSGENGPSPGQRKGGRAQLSVAR